VTAFPVPAITPTFALPLGRPSTFQDREVLEVPEMVAVSEMLSPRLTEVDLGLNSKLTFTATFEIGVVIIAAPPPPPLQAIKEQIIPMARMPNRRT
jgi:hypothetical protein